MDFKKLDFAKMLENAMRQQTRESLFPWQSLLQDADEVIARVGTHFEHGTRPTDLTPFREPIAKLLSELVETYLTARDDFEARIDPHRPERKLRKKDFARYGGIEPARAKMDPSTPDDFDVSTFLEEPGESWEQYWDREYKRPRGNPGKSRRGGPPIQPLYPIYDMVRQWWRLQELGAFSPLFNCEAKHGEGYQEAAFNGPLRFLFAVIQTLDPGYTIENVRSVYEKRQKDLKARKKVI
jgi:hypothetical protein